MVGQEALIGVSVGRIKDLPLAPKIQAGVSNSQYRRASHSWMAEIKRLIEVGCFELVDMKDIPRGRKLVDSKWVHTYKGGDVDNSIKTKSRFVAKGCIQVQDVDYCGHCNDWELTLLAGICSGPCRRGDIHASPSGL